MMYLFLLQGSIVHITSPVVDPVTKADTPTNEKVSMGMDIHDETDLLSTIDDLLKETDSEKKVNW